MVVVAGFSLGASSLSAQSDPAPDSARAASLATVTVSAQSGTWFTRAELRGTIVDAIAENRRLAAELQRQDAEVVRMAVRLDSLKRIEFVQTIAIAAITDSVSATRALRRSLEARVVALETRLPQP